MFSLLICIFFIGELHLFYGKEFLSAICFCGVMLAMHIFFGKFWFNFIYVNSLILGEENRIEAENLMYHYFYRVTLLRNLSLMSDYRGLFLVTLLQSFVVFYKTLQKDSSLSNLYSRYVYYDHLTAYDSLVEKAVHTDLRGRLNKFIEEWDYDKVVVQYLSDFTELAKNNPSVYTEDLFLKVEKSTIKNLLSL